MKRYCSNFIYLISFKNETNAIRKPCEMCNETKTKEIQTKQSCGESERDGNRMLCYTMVFLPDNIIVFIC